VGGTIGPDGSRTTAPAAVVSLPPKRAGTPRPDILVAGALPSDDNAAQVVLTADQAKRMGWGPADAIGKRVRFTGLLQGPPGTGGPEAREPQSLVLTVVGVASGAPGGDPSWALLPYLTANVFTDHLLSANPAWTRDPYVGVTLVADSLSHVGDVRDEAQQAGYSASTNEDELRAFAQRLNYVEIALAGLAVIALAVAALGIANTMFSAVLERTREIGVYKALGCRARDLTMVFVAESAMIGVAGGLVGVAVADLLAAVGNSLIDQVAHSQGDGSGLRLFQLNPWIGVLGIALAILVSALSGMLPALRASRLDPVQAIRYE
jgi:ABC-type lipoprotein release transport system permease subunit